MKLLLSAIAIAFAVGAHGLLGSAPARAQSDIEIESESKFADSEAAMADAEEAKRRAKTEKKREIEANAEAARLRDESVRTETEAANRRAQFAAIESAAIKGQKAAAASAQKSRAKTAVFQAQIAEIQRKTDVVNASLQRSLAEQDRDEKIATSALASLNQARTELAAVNLKKQEADAAAESAATALRDAKAQLAGNDTLEKPAIERLKKQIADRRREIRVLDLQYKNLLLRLDPTDSRAPSSAASRATKSP